MFNVAGEMKENRTDLMNRVRGTVQYVLTVHLIKPAFLNPSLKK